ncbi:MAG: response regulator [Deltaproteobacteria bacterium]|nr:response regulator [Deltaproteobacteria bacterium]
MAERRVLVIDNDQSFSSLLQNALSPYGVDVAVVQDHNDGLGLAKELEPELLFIAVELPDKLGYATCNKAKKGIAKNIPVVLATASVPPSDLEQHRKLRVHADEYMDKRTLSRDELITKVDGLIGLGPPIAVDDLELPLDAEEIAIDEEPIGEETTGGALVQSDGFGAAYPEGDVPSSEILDEGIDAETEAAFAAMGMGEPIIEESFEGDESAATHFRGEQGPAAGHEQAFEEVADAGSIVEEIPMAVDMAEETEFPEMPELVEEQLEAPENGAGFAPTEYATEYDALVVRETPAADSFEQVGKAPVEAALAASGSSDIDLGLEDVAAQAAPWTPQGADESGPLRARVTELELECERLRSAVEEAKKSQAPAATSFSREREFLNLRELINRKEKEIIDLKEEVDSKDRHVLTAKERTRELERRQREGEERLLSVEGSLVTANETIAGLTRDKEMAAEREKGLKARLEIAQSESRKAYEESDILKKKLTAETQELSQALAREKTEVAQIRKEAAAKLAELEASKVALEKRLMEEKTRELAAASQARAQELERQARDHGAEIDAQKKDHARELAALRSSHEAALGDKEQKAESARRQLVEQHEAAMRAALERHRGEIAAQEEKRENELAEAEDRRQADLNAQLQEHRRALEEQSKLHADDLARLAAEKARELEAQAARHASETKALRAQADKERTDLEAGHAVAVADLRAEMRAEIDDLNKGLATARDRVKALEGELQAAQASISAREKSIAGYQKDIEDLQAEVGELKRAIEELEKQNASYQEQVLKAYQKIKSDEAVVQKAKKAMAIALTLLDGDS